METAVSKGDAQQSSAVPGTPQPTGSSWSHTVAERRRAKSTDSQCPSLAVVEFCCLPLVLVRGKRGMETNREANCKSCPGRAEPRGDPDGLTLKLHLGSAAGLDAPPCQGTASRNLSTTGAHTILPQISALL